MPQATIEVDRVVMELSVCWDIRLPGPHCHLLSLFHTWPPPLPLYPSPPSNSASKLSIGEPEFISMEEVLNHSIKFLKE